MRDILNVLKFSKQLRGYYIGIMLLSVVVALINLAQPFIVKSVIDELSLPAFSEKKLIIFVILYFLSDVAITIFSNVGGYLGDMMTVKLRRFLSERYYSHLLKLPQRYFDNQRTGALVNKLSRSIENLTQTLQFFSNSALQLVITTVLTIAITAYYSVIAAVLMFALYPLLFWLTTRSSEKWQEIEHKKNSLLDDALGRFTEVVAQMSVVKSFRQGPREFKLFEGKFGDVIPLTDTQSRFWHKQDIFRRLVLNIIFAGIFGTIVWQTSNSDLDLGELILLIQFAQLMRVPLFSLSFIVDSGQRAIAGSRDFFEVMNLDTEEDAESETAIVEKLDVTDAGVTFDNVSFSYEELAVIEKLSFNIKSGQKLALVSESGGGKSTLANLLIGLYEPTSGTIKVGGQDIKAKPLSWIREQVGVVFQDAELFSGSIYENISYAIADSSIEKVEEAAKAANAHKFIKQLPDGYYTQIGERGVKLSGGQKQRIAIARALLKDAPILILDEATSALDSKTEVEVQAALEVLMENRTSLIIAHRLSTISNVDQILTLKDGGIDEIGSPAELAETGGIYSQLVQLQNADPEERKKYLEQFDLSL